MKRRFGVHQFRIDPDEDVREEIETHLEMEKERLVAQGMREVDAEREAEARFGDRSRFEADARKEARAKNRRTFWRSLTDSIMGDIRFGARRLRKTPGFTLAIVLVLGIGIGGNSSIFSVLRGAILADPPYPQPDQLVLPSLAHVYPTYTYHGASFPEFEMIRDFPNRLVDPLAGYTYLPVTLSGIGEAERIDAEVVTPDYFRLLGVSARIGRTFSSTEGDPASPPMVAILGEGLWASLFGRDPAIPGREVLVNGNAMTIVGVMPRGFRGVTGKGRLWIPMAASGVLLDAWRTTDHGSHWFSLIGRLRPGANVGDAEAQLLPLARETRDRWPNHGRGGDLVPAVQPFRAVATNGRVKTSLLLLSLAAGLVLLIVCANVAGLLLARANARAKETAIRLAIGAGRFRVARQYLTESLILGVMGGLVGLALAVWGVDSLTLLSPETQVSGANELEFIDFGRVGIDAGVVFFTMGISVVTALLFGVLPALKLSRPTQVEELREPMGAGQSGRRIFRGPDLRDLLVGGQIATALILLVGAGLMLVSMGQLQRVETGIDEESLLTFSYTLPRSAAESTNPHFTVSDTDATEIMLFHEDFLARLRSLPGVLGATMGCPPLGGVCGTSFVGSIVGRPEIPQSDQLPVGSLVVEGAYFQTVGARLEEGRTFTTADGREAPQVLVLNTTAAQQLFPDGNALGQRISLGHSVMPEGTSAEVVGVVRDVLYGSPDAGLRPVVYLSSLQVPTARPTFIVRTANDPYSILPAARVELGALNANVPIHEVSTITELGLEATGNSRFVMRVLSAFAILSAILAILGIYAAVAYAVSQRNREIGIRIALGARADQTMLLFLRRGATVAGVGIVFGLIAAVGFTRLLASLLFEVGAIDPLTFALAALALFGSALLATYFPARRVTRIDPIEALRTE